jgi:hypothetical protein
MAKRGLRYGLCPQGCGWYRLTRAGKLFHHEGKFMPNQCPSSGHEPDFDWLMVFWPKRKRAHEVRRCAC